MCQWLPSPIRMVELCDGALADARRAFQNWAFEPRPVIPRELPVKSQSSQGDGNPTQCYVHLVTPSRSTRCPAKNTPLLHSCAPCLQQPFSGSVRSGNSAGVACSGGRKISGKSEQSGPSAELPMFNLKITAETRCLSLSRELLFEHKLLQRCTKAAFQPIWLPAKSGHICHFRKCPGSCINQAAVCIWRRLSRS